MIELLLTIVPSVCWLLYRCYQLLQTPVESLVEDLNIEIPHSPNICIDSIQKSSVVIHWDIEMNKSENLYYVLLVNNKEAACLTLNSCKLNNLVENKLYQIQVIAINSITNFRSQSTPVFIQTLPKNKDFIPKSFGTKNIMNEGTKINLNEVSNEQIRKIEDVKVLNDYLSKYQQELCKVNNELINFEDGIKEEHGKLLEELIFYKKEFEEETDNKLKKDNSVKDLEKQKEQLLYKKTKLLQELKKFENFKDINDSKLIDYQIKIKKLNERKNHIIKNEEQEKAKITKQINDIKAEIENYKHTNDNLEEHCKKLLSERKELNNLLNQLKPLIETYTNPNPPSPNASSTSLINPTNNEELLLKILNLKPEWSDEIIKEIELVNQFENDWKIAYRNEIRKYLSIRNSLEISRVNLDSNYQPTMLTEYQASIEICGFHNALPKNINPKIKKSNWSNPPSIQLSDESLKQPNVSVLNQSSSSPSPVPLINEESINYPPMSNLNNDNWYKFYGQVYSNDQQDSLLTPLNQTASLNSLNLGPVNSNLNPNLTNLNPPKLRFPYDDQIYTQNSPIDESLYSYSSPQITKNTLSTMWSDHHSGPGTPNSVHNNLAAPTSAPAAPTNNPLFGQSLNPGELTNDYPLDYLLWNNGNNNDINSSSLWRTENSFNGMGSGGTTLLGANNNPPTMNNVNLNVNLNNLNNNFLNNQNLLGNQFGLGGIQLSPSLSYGQQQEEEQNNPRFF